MLNKKVQHNVKINLEELMWRNRIKSITELSQRTKINRVTLTKLKKNEAAGINLDTLQTLCAHLNCEPGDLFSVQRSS